MSRRTKIVLAFLGGWALLLILFGIIFGTHRTHSEFLPQNEFKLDPWISLPGPFDVNKAILYLIIAAVLTVGTMTYVARRMQQRPNRVQTGVELLYTQMRDNIVGGNMDRRTAAKWFPFIAALFLFIWYSNLIGYIPLPTNTNEKFELFGVQIPAFALFAATANVSVPLALALVVFISFNVEGIRAKGVGGYLKSLLPPGIHGPAAIPIFFLELLSTCLRLVSLSVRLFANILSGHLIILFMSGGLAVLLGLAWVGILTIPLGIALFIFEVGLVATLQAFIFAVLSAIYIGGAVAESH
ncbi:MAG TPA: F0F1 ATP synthase subunit A [Gaiellaceae bacterium]|nr:F0F1 ATP synthase subunit A [Gaiellaceae bacterium]